MSRPLYRPEPLTHQVFRGRDAIDAGLITPAHLRGPAWQRLLHGIYADSRVPVDHGVRCRAAALAIPDAAVLTGPSAAWLFGVELAAAEEPVHVLAPRSEKFGPVRGLRVHLDELVASERTTAGGVAVTSPARTAWQLAAWLPITEAVSYLDQLLRTRVVTVAELTAIARSRRHRRGGRAAYRAIALADGRAESPAESRLRVRLALDGVPAPVPQYEVRHTGELLARVDLAWPQHRVALEYDGAWHASRTQLAADRRRLNRLVTAGWTVLHVTADQLRQEFPRLVSDLRRTLAYRRPP